MLKEIINSIYTQSYIYKFTLDYDAVDTFLSVFCLLIILRIIYNNSILKSYTCSKFWKFLFQDRILKRFNNNCSNSLHNNGQQLVETNYGQQSQTDIITQHKTYRLPEIGLKYEKIQDILSNWIKRDSKLYGCKKISGWLYVIQDEKFLEGVLNFSKLFIYSNPMHADLWPATRQMEAEIIQMTGELLGQEKESIGIITTGGTESILLAMLAYRNWAYECKGITHPNIIIPESAHAAFYRAGEYFKIEIRIAKLTEDYIVDLSDIQKKIDKNTICLVGSFGNYPYGTHDSIEQLALIAKKQKVGLHVDACLGGFIAIFARDHGTDLGKWTFQLNGVTSISCDQHKHGLSPKGVSTIFFNTKQLRQFAYFSLATWSGGCYATASIQGSKSGVSIAGAWFALQYLGKKKYIQYSKKIMDATQLLANKLNQIPEITVLGKPMINVVTFKSNQSKLNTYSIHQLLQKMGWVVTATQNPAGVHLSITQQNVDNLTQYIIDIKNAIKQIQENPDQYNQDESMGTLYGTTSKISNPKQAGKQMKMYLDSLLKL